MPRWSPDAALRLEAAAVVLFERQGFSETTVPQIAAEAGLTTRTFFRHFADKRDVMFLRDREFPSVVQHALSAASADEAALTATLRGLERVFPELEGWREPIARRQRIIQAEPALLERSLLSSRHLAASIEQALLIRGTPACEARVLSTLASTCFALARERWLERTSSVGLSATFHEVWNAARTTLTALS